jgi:glycosyltransferase involved in cell wall biosynthesis
MRLVFVTQVVDPASPVLGATVAKLRALAARVDEVEVLADGAVAGALPDNCRVHLFAARTRAGRGARFERALTTALLRRPRPAAVVAHMCPIYAVLAAPAARPLGVRVMLWFTHWKSSRLLRLAERLSTDVLTVEPRTFPLASPKVNAIGHGIDLSEFACAERPGDDALALLSLARTSPAKGLETVIRAVALVPEARLVQHGPSLTVEEQRHRGELERLAEALGIGDRVTIGDAVPRGEVPRLLTEADALVNNMRAGATDKAVYEAAASCLPVLASNPALDGFLPAELRFDRDEPESLAAGIRALAAADRAALGRALRGRVESEHSVEGWADRVVEISGAT